MTPATVPTGPARLDKTEVCASVGVSPAVSDQCLLFLSDRAATTLSGPDCC